MVQGFVSYLRGKAIQCSFVAIFTLLARPGYAYELYSWQVNDGSWNFSVLPSTNSEKPVKQVFSDATRLQSIAVVKSRLAKLPPGAILEWVARIPMDMSRAKAAGSEALGIPPLEIIDEVGGYATARGLKLGGPALQGFELYSWKVSDGSWNFFVGPNLNSNLSAEAVFSERTRLQSIEELKSQLEQLPRGATLFWMTHISAGPNRPKAARSEALGVPPPDMVKEIRGYTDALGLKLDLSIICYPPTRLPTARPDC